MCTKLIESAPSLFEKGLSADLQWTKKKENILTSHHFFFHRSVVQQLNLLVFFEVDAGVCGCDFLAVDHFCLFHPA